MRVSEGTILGTGGATPRMTVTGLQIDVIRDKQGTLMHLNGCLNIDSSPSLRDRLLTILQPEAPEVLTVDLSEVSHVDSSGSLFGDHSCHGPQGSLRGE
jgi:hypothetical protein